MDNKLKNKIKELKGVQGEINEKFNDCFNKKISTKTYNEESDRLFTEKRQLLADIEHKNYEKV